MKSWKNLALTLTLIFGTIPTLASDEFTGFRAPYILMTPLELQNLPEDDRDVYVGRVRQMLSSDPEAPIEFNGLSEHRWSEAYFGLQKFCEDAKDAVICEQLQEQRIAVFEARASH